MSTTRRWAAVVAVAGVLTLATACIPQPTGQSVPAGGKVVATSAALTDLEIDSTSDDLSTIVYTVMPFDPSGNVNFAYRVYDEQAGGVTPLPVGHGRVGGTSVAPEGRSVVFSADDPDLQAGPTAQNCWRGTGPTGPPYVPATCGELYVYDLDTHAARQLTGLGGPSIVSSFAPRFTTDGTAVEFSVSDGRNGSTFGYRHLDLATGDVTTGSPPPALPTTWTRGDHDVVWDGTTGTLTSVDHATGDVTTLWADPQVWSLGGIAGDGRYVVVSTWTTDIQEIYRLIDTDTRSIRTLKTHWLSSDGTRQAVVQRNVAPDGTSRLILAPL